MIQVRDFLRRGRGGFSVNLIESLFEDSGVSCDEFLGALISEGMVEAVAGRDGRYRPTMLGQRLANATAARKIRRRTANEAVAYLLERARETAVDPEFLWAVKEIKVFGSYLSDVAYLSDVDVCVTLVPKLSSDEMVNAAMDQTREAESAGRSFRNCAELICWPRTRVLRHLRGRKRCLSIQDGDDPILEQTPWKYLYRMNGDQDLAGGESDEG